MKENTETPEQISHKLAEDHVNWFLATLRPLLIDHLMHGFKHGVEYAVEEHRRRDDETEML